MAESQSVQAELVVIGAGPGGYAAAFAAADKGLAVTLVNDDPQPGGVCLHRGCIPSKALLHVAKLIHEAREALEWGVSFSEPTVDLEKLRAFKNSVITKLTGGVSGLCQSRKVKYVSARARFVGSNTLELIKENGVKETLEFKHAILATGSSPIVPPIFQINDPRVMDSTGALELIDIPNRLLVVGGGYIGLELGSVYAALGSNVTVVEMTAGLLPGADRDLVGPLKKRLESCFAAIYLKTKVMRLTSDPDGIIAEFEGQNGTETETFDRVLVAVGRRPNSGGLGLENTRVELDERGFVKTDLKRRTSDPSIFAIGDLAGEPMLAHKATREAKVAVDTLLGKSASFVPAAIPAVVFTDPEIAWCGLTHNAAKATGRNVSVVRFPWAASGRAQTLGRTEGLTKIIVDPKSDRILGVGIVGPGAGELIAEAVLAVETGTTARQLAESIHPHPTLSETLMEAAESYFGEATHIFRPPRRSG